MCFWQRTWGKVLCWSTDLVNTAAAFSIEKLLYAIILYWKSLHMISMKHNWTWCRRCGQLLNVWNHNRLGLCCDQCKAFSKVELWDKDCEINKLNQAFHKCSTINEITICCGVKPKGLGYIATATGPSESHGPGLTLLKRNKLLASETSYLHWACWSCRPLHPKVSGQLSTSSCVRGFLDQVNHHGEVEEWHSTACIRQVVFDSWKELQWTCLWKLLKRTLYPGSKRRLGSHPPGRIQPSCQGCELFQHLRTFPENWESLEFYVFLEGETLEHEVLELAALELLEDFAESEAKHLEHSASWALVVDEVQAPVVWWLLSKWTEM